MAKNRGRPISEGGAKKNKILIKLNDEEEEQLDYISFKEEKSKSDVIRKALRIYYNLEKSKE